MAHSIGEELIIEAAELVAGGAALARIDGFPIFVTNVYPGDVEAVLRTRGNALGGLPCGSGLRTAPWCFRLLLEEDSVP